MSYAQVMDPARKGRPPGHRCDPSHLWRCEACPATFHRPAHWRSRSNTGRYCSNACRVKALNELPKWNTGNRTPQVTAKGYVRIWDGSRYILEHVQVMEQWIGRWLLPAERVHHLDGDRANNTRPNLILFASQRDHLWAMHPDLAQNLGRGQPLSTSKKAVLRRERRRAERNYLAAVPLAASRRYQVRQPVVPDDAIPGHDVLDRAG